MPRINLFIYLLSLLSELNYVVVEIEDGLSCYCSF